MNGDYPYSLKQRVGGRFGHLNNQEAAGILARLDVSRLQHLIAAHLSRRNNTPELAVRALSGAIDVRRKLGGSGNAGRRVRLARNCLKGTSKISSTFESCGNPNRLP